MNRAIIYLLAFLLVLVPAGALEEEFVMLGPADLRACSCDIIQNNITIQNTGYAASSYQLSSVGETAGWSSYAPASFYLEPGERGVIRNFIQIPCDAVGKHALKTKAKTFFGTEKTITQHITSQTCSNIEAYLVNYTTRICPCKTMVYEIDVSNIRDFVEIYTLELSKYSQYAAFNENPFMIAPYSKKKIFLYLNLPCSVYGAEEIDLNILTQNTRLDANLKLPINISRCYDYDLILNREYVLCKDVPNLVSFNITNNAYIANRYTIDLEGPEWAAFSDYTVGLPAYSNEIFSVNITPIETGEFNLTLKTITKLGDLDKTAPMRFISENCYSINTTLPEVVNTVECETEGINYEIKNIGTRDIDVDFMIKGPTWSEIDISSSLLIPEGTKQALMVNLNVPCDTRGTHNLETSAYISKYPKFYKNDSSLLNIFSKEDAYKPIVTLDKTNINYKNDSIKITVRNNGVKDATYLFQLEIGPPWMWLNQTNLSLSPGETGQISILTDPEGTPENDFKVVLATGAEGILYKDAFVVKLRVQTIKEILLKFWLAYWAFIIGVAILVILIFLMVIGIIKFRYAKFWKILLVLLIVLIVIAGIYLLSQLRLEKEKPLVTINKTGLETADNIVVIRDIGETRIPLIITNDRNKTLMIDLTTDIGWIELRPSLVIVPPNRIGDADIVVNVTEETEDGDYSINIAEETITLRIKKTSGFFEKYWYWLFLIPILILVIFALFRKLKTREVVKKERRGRKKFLWTILIVILVLFIAWIIYLNAEMFFVPVDQTPVQPEQGEIPVGYLLAFVFAVIVVALIIYGIRRKKTRRLVRKGMTGIRLR